jgi:uncharacterized protein (DUF2384 family)
MTLIAFDLRHPEMAAHELGAANRQLAREDEVPESIVRLIRDLCDQIADTGTEALQGIDPYFWIELQQAALRAQQVAYEDDPTERRRRARVALEQLRFLLTRLAERQPVAEDRPIEEVVRWLDAVVAVPQRRKAHLLNVSARTYQRWVSATDATRPEGEDERAIRLLARIVSQLRHSLGGGGVVDWLTYPREELDGARPIDLLRVPEATDRLLGTAVATRSIAAA